MNRIEPNVYLMQSIFNSCFFHVCYNHSEFCLFCTATHRFFRLLLILDTEGFTVIIINRTNGTPTCCRALHSGYLAMWRCLCVAIWTTACVGLGLGSSWLVTLCVFHCRMCVFV